MLKERAKEVAYLVALVDIVLVWVAFLVAYFVRFELAGAWDPTLPLLTPAKSLWLPVLSMPTFYVLFAAAGVYASLRTRPVRDLPWLVGKPVALGGLFLGAVIFLVQAKYFSRSLFGLFLLTF